VVIQRIENYLLDWVKSGGRVRRTLALLALTVGGLLALAVGALAAFAQIAALYLVAGLMGHDQPDSARLGARRLHVPGVAVLAMVAEAAGTGCWKVGLTPRAPGSCPLGWSTPRRAR
jgi:hypothetical protein